MIQTTGSWYARKAPVSLHKYSSHVISVFLLALNGLENFPLNFALAFEIYIIIIIFHSLKILMNTKSCNNELSLPTIPQLTCPWHWWTISYTSLLGIYQE